MGPSAGRAEAAGSLSRARMTSRWIFWSKSPSARQGSSSVQAITCWSGLCRRGGICQRTDEYFHISCQLRLGRSFIRWPEAGLRRQKLPGGHQRGICAQLCRGKSYILGAWRSARGPFFSATLWTNLCSAGSFRQVRKFHFWAAHGASSVVLTAGTTLLVEWLHGAAMPAWSFRTKTPRGPCSFCWPTNALRSYPHSLRIPH